MKGLITFCAAAVLILSTGSAHADMTIYFDYLPNGTFIDDQFLGLGADFNGLARICAYSAYPTYSSPNVIENLNPAIIRGNIKVDRFGAEWLMAGGWVIGEDIVTLTAYDSSGFILGTPSLTGGANLDAEIFLSVSAANIDYVIFSIDSPNIFTVDDFTFVPVPVPAAVLLGMLGLGVAGLKLRKFS